MELKCENCGAALTLTDAVCPYCGTKNEKAKGHIAEKAYYGELYEETAALAKTSRRINRRVLCLGAVLVLLIAGIVFNLYFAENGRRLLLRMRNQLTSMRHASYSARIDEFLARGDYLAVDGMRWKYGINDPNDSGYQRYNDIFSAALYYSLVCKEVMKGELNNHEVYVNSPDTDRPNFTSMGKYLGEFYEALEEAKESQRDAGADAQLTTEHLTRMRDTLHAVFQTYYGADDALLSDFPDMQYDALTEQLEVLYDNAHR